MIPMQNNRTFHARRIFAALGALAALALAGCATSTVTNMTPSKLVANPSQTYTITARVKPSASNVIPGSQTVRIVIDNKAYKMTQTPNIENVYEFDYKAPAGLAEIRYYFLVDYSVSNSGIVSAREDYSPLQHGAIIDRGSHGLNANRGPVGARIAITGRGFTASDNVFFDNTPVRPTFESQNSLSFNVPALKPNRTYAVSVGDAPGKMPVGSFRIDPAIGAAQGEGYAMATNAPAASATTRASAATTRASASAAPAATTRATTQTFGGSTNVAGTFGAADPDTAFSANAPEFAPAPAGARASATVSPAAFMGNDISINEPTRDITVSPSEINVRSGDYIAVKFILPRIVTVKPLLIEVTTDIPESVIMPEVYAKVGSNVGSVNLKGGRPGKGRLYVKAAGYPKVQTIPITVK